MIKDLNSVAIMSVQVQVSPHVGEMFISLCIIDNYKDFYLSGDKIVSQQAKQRGIKQKQRFIKNNSFKT